VANHELGAARICMTVEAFVGGRMCSPSLESTTSGSKHMAGVGIRGASHSSRSRA
jgi:hypothetical protein